MKDNKQRLCDAIKADVTSVKQTTNAINKLVGRQKELKKLIQSPIKGFYVTRN